MASQFAAVMPAPSNRNLEHTLRSWVPGLVELPAPADRSPRRRARFVGYLDKTFVKRRL